MMTKMFIEIFNVELGQCAMIHCPNGQKVMVDTGHNTSKAWYPSEHFRGQPIERLIISNFDEDHVSDLEDVMKHCGVRMLYRNVSVNLAHLASMKADGGMGPGISYLYRWMQHVEGPNGIRIQPADLGGVQISHYFNPYGNFIGQFADTNNLSFISFVSFAGFTILFPGDLEASGWKALLQTPVIQQELRKVTVLVASHHGRENGCCPEIFNYCTPQAVIISDASVQYATQETTNWYAGRTSGCQTRAGASRKVFTTRNDGHIYLQADINSRWGIETEVERNARGFGTR